MAGVAEGIRNRVGAQFGPAWEMADAAVKWLSLIHDKLGRMVELQQESSARDEYHRLTVKITTDATGAGNHIFEARQGWHYQLVNIAVTSVAGETGAALTYIGGNHPSNLLHVTALGQYTSDIYPDGTYIPVGSKPAVYLNAAAASQDIWVNILAKVLPTGTPIPVQGGGEA